MKNKEKISKILMAIGIVGFSLIALVAAQGIIKNRQTPKISQAANCSFSFTTEGSICTSTFVVAGPTSSPIPTNSPTPMPTQSPSPTPAVCVSPDPKDPPVAYCAPTLQTKGKVDWTWAPLGNNVTYEIDIVRSDGVVMFDNAFKDGSVYGCGSGTCKYTTELAPGSYRSKLRAHAPAAPGGVECTPSNWSITDFVRVSVCPTPSPTRSACTNKSEDVVLVIDRSDSMNKFEDGKSKLAWAKSAAIAFIDTVAKSPNSGGIRIGVSVFGMRGNNVGNPASIYASRLISHLTSNYTNLKTLVQNIARTDSGTCIECGLRIANQELSNSTVPKNVILLSDGDATHLWDGTLYRFKARQEAVARANTGRASGITYYVVGFGDRVPVYETVLKNIAGKESNYAYRPDADTWAQSFKDFLTQICKE